MPTSKVHPALPTHALLLALLLVSAAAVLLPACCTGWMLCIRMPVHVHTNKAQKLTRQAAAACLWAPVLAWAAAVTHCPWGCGTLQGLGNMAQSLSHTPVPAVAETAVKVGEAVCPRRELEHCQAGADRDAYPAEDHLGLCAH